MNHRLFSSLVVRSLSFALALFTSSATTLAGDWPEFLGPGGRARTAEVVATQWSESENLIWTHPWEASGSSSPIVVGDRVLVTGYRNQGDSLERQLICLNKRSGERQWTADFPVDDREDAYQGYLTEHGYASNTPVSDGRNVFVFLGKGGVHALDLDGKVLWSVNVGNESSNRQWGSAASLLLYGDLLIVNASEESQSIIALDKTTGKEIWRQQAQMLELTYGTPRIVTLADGRDELVLSVPGELWGMNPDSGKLQWFAETPLTGNVSPSVIVDGQTVFSFGGFRSSGSLAVRAGGKKEVTETHVLWNNRSSSYVATPLLHEGRLYWIDDRGIAYCTSASDGEVIYRERVQGLRGGGRPVYASPVLVGDHIYAVTRHSGTLVYRPGDGFEPVAQNQIAGDDSDFNASPAVSDGRLYLRSDQAIYCIGTNAD